MTNLLTKDLTDDFWNDCSNNQISTKLNKFFPYKYFSKTLGRNSDRETIKNKSKYLINLYSYQFPHNKTKRNNNSLLTKLKHKSMDNSNFSKIYNKHPMLHEKNIHSQENKDLQKKKKKCDVTVFGALCIWHRSQKRKNVK
jgi:hypothetical protein